MPNGQAVPNAPAAAAANPGAIIPTFYIGLGGTGKEILLRLRRRVYNEFGTPGLPCVGYLWLDTDTSNRGAITEEIDPVLQEVLFSEEAGEQISLLQGRVGALMDRIIDNPAQYRHIHEWLYPEVDQYGREVTDGAGNIRAIGRFCFFLNYSTIRDSLFRTINRIRDAQAIDTTRQIPGLAGAQFAHDRVRVIVVGSVAGGTGSGLMLDTGFLLRDITERLQLPAQIISLFGLPNIYFERPDDEQHKRSYANAYASLKELEFFMLRRHFDAGAVGRQEVTIDFGVEWVLGHPQLVKGPPFTTSYFFEAGNQDVPINPTGRAEIFRSIANALYQDFLPGPFSTMKRTSYANVTQYLQLNDTRNFQAAGVQLTQYFSRRYAAFGFSRIEIPTDEIRLACAAQLAHDIFAYWTRGNIDVNLQTIVVDELATRELDATGIPERFDQQWRQSIIAETNRLFGGAVAEPKAVQALLDDLRAVQNKLFFRNTLVWARLGSVVSFLRKSTDQVTRQAESDLKAWIQSSLEKESWGLALTVAEGGVLEHAETLISDLQLKFSQMGVAAKSTLDEGNEKLEKLAGELKRALQSVVLVAFGSKSYAVERLLLQMKRVAEETLVAEAKITLLEESQKVAGALKINLAIQKKRLEAAHDAFLVQRGTYLREVESHLDFGGSVLSVRYFEKERDWGLFYTLDTDVNGTGAKVNPTRESERFIAGLDVTGGMMTVVEKWENNDYVFTQKVKRYCEKRVSTDFAANPRQVKVIDRLMARPNWQQDVEKLVRCALPLVNFAAREGVAQRQAYLGLPRVPSPNDEGQGPEGQAYARLIATVRGLMYQKGFNQLDPVPDTPVSEIYLYTVEYAFPIAHMLTVTNACHEEYYKFYRELQQGRLQNGKYQIPLHINQRWEGKFEDLRIYADREAEKYAEASRVLLLGSILKVVKITFEPAGRILGMGGLVPIDRDAEGNLRGSYRFSLIQDHFGLQQDHPEYRWPGHFAAHEYLRSHDAERRYLIGLINSRREGLRSDQLEAYYWALGYLSFHPSLYPELSIERTIINGEYSSIVASHPSLGQKRPDPSNMLEDIKGFVDKLGADWVGEFPTLKELEYYRVPE